MEGSTVNYGTTIIDKVDKFIVSGKNSLHMCEIGVQLGSKNVLIRKCFLENR